MKLFYFSIVSVANSPRCLPSQANAELSPYLKHLLSISVSPHFCHFHLPVWVKALNTKSQKPPECCLLWWHSIPPFNSHCDHCIICSSKYYFLHDNTWSRSSWTFWCIFHIRRHHHCKNNPKTLSCSVEQKSNSCNIQSGNSLSSVPF